VGAGDLTGARLLAEIGDDRTRFANARALKAAPGRRQCYVIGSANPAHSASSEVSLARRRHVQKIQAEPEAQTT
jgi:hypothetical protein